VWKRSVLICDPQLIHREDVDHIGIEALRKRSTLTFNINIRKTRGFEGILFKIRISIAYIFENILHVFYVVFTKFSKLLDNN